MLHIINAKNLIDMESETHYSFREGIPLGEYPQVHDFFEFTLVTSGEFTLILNGNSSIIKKGTLILIPPGIIHSKYPIKNIYSTHINLAMPTSTINSLFCFLYEKKSNDMIDVNHLIFPLSNNEMHYIQSEMEYLSLFPVSEKEETRTHLRRLLVSLIYEIIIPSYKEKDKRMLIPQWLQKIISDFENQDNLCKGSAYIFSSAGKTKEYICRSFKKYLKTTPTVYVNTRRLYYAANMLQHSNREITQLSEDLGYSSLSYFYKLFRKEYGMTPKQYRKTFQSI